MSIDSIDLPDDFEALRELAVRQQEQIDAQLHQLDEKASLIDAQADELRTLREYIRLFKHQRFGRKSEQANGEQIWLFNEAEATLPDADPGEEADAPVFNSNRMTLLPISRVAWDLFQLPTHRVL